MELPKEFNNKLKKFLDAELNDLYYQSVIVITDGKVEKEKGISTSTVFTSNTAPTQTPFVIIHDLIQSLEYSVIRLVKGLYGGIIQKKQDEKKKIEDEIGSGIYR